jgi:hypothetical protein
LQTPPHKITMMANLKNVEAVTKTVQPTKKQQQNTSA